MMQSNMVCVALAAVGLASIQNQSIIAVLATLVLTADAVLGTSIFVAMHQKEITQSLSFVRKIRSFKQSSKTS